MPTLNHLRSLLIIVFALLSCFIISSYFNYIGPLIFIILSIGMLSTMIDPIYTEKDSIFWKKLYISCNDLTKFKTILEDYITENNNNNIKFLINQIHDRETLLKRAVIYQNVQVVKYLLENGANPNVYVIKSPLTLSIELDNLEIVKLLINYPIDDMIRGLLYCNDLEIAKLLIDRGANVNYFDRNWKTPLTKAIDKANHPMIKLLMAHGANTYS